MAELSRNPEINEELEEEIEVSFGRACYWFESFQDMNATCKFCNCSKTDYDYDPVCKDCKYYISKSDVEKMVEKFQARKI